PPRHIAHGTLPWLLFVHQPERSGEEPRKSVPEPVAPVLPVVAVARLDVADGHSGRLEQGYDRPVLVDERFVDPAAHEELLGGMAGRRPEGVDELHHRLEVRPALVRTDV